ncbi:hypothetical protein APR11_006510 [Nocardia amikacinitolerans]|nr:hypothetical protein [Nocardia amikacinitolerans]MCP2300045.1 hypothetical protein [Nocardia amikacinitolerans]
MIREFASTIQTHGEAGGLSEAMTSPSSTEANNRAVPANGPKAVFTMTGSPSADAETQLEKSCSIPDGPELTVGISDLAAHPIAVVNGMPTDPEVLLDTTRLRSGRVVPE